MKSHFHFPTLFAIAFAALVPGAIPALAETAKIGVAGAVSGSVSVKGEDGTARVLKTGDDVHANDTITSDEASKAQVMFLDRSALMIHPSTEVKMDSFVYDPATSAGDLAISSTKGSLRFIGGILSKGKPAKIKTPVAAIGIRGAIIDVHIGEAGETDTIFIYGKELTMQNAEGGQVMSVTTIGQGLALQTAHGIPAPLVPEKIEEYLSAVDAGDGVGKDANAIAPVATTPVQNTTPPAPSQP